MIKERKVAHLKDLAAGMETDAGDVEITGTHIAALTAQPQFSPTQNRQRPEVCAGYVLVRMRHLV